MAAQASPGRTSVKVLLIGRHQSIEPLGLQALAGVAREAGWDRDVVLVRDGDFDKVVEHALSTRPDVVAMSVWTGFHLQSFRAADAMRAAGLRVAIGGPHATYFSESCASHADWVSKGAGFRTFRRILDGDLAPGVHFDEERLAGGFPLADRASVYASYPDLAASQIKSMMNSVGCPFTCVTGDTLICLDDGLDTVANIVARLPMQRTIQCAHDGMTHEVRELDFGEPVATDTGRHIARTILDQGLQTVYELEASNGFRLKATAQHPMLSLQNGVRVRTPISELRIGDFVAVQSAHRQMTGADQPYEYAHVVSINRLPEPEPVYDLTVPNAGTFVANGFTVANCSYCYATELNLMYGGFTLNARPVDDVIREAQEIRDKWPAQLIYFQDDVYGFNIPWLEEFARRWPVEVGIPWHCQIRLEMTREERRLDLFKAGGCTGITLAIESGNDFLRRYVLQRAMPDELIVEGIRKIQARGLTLRTEQILAVPFSDLSTDLETLELNTRLNPEMAWTSILAPYGGTAMGTIAAKFGFYEGNNDDLSETFFDRSVLKHTVGGWRAIEPMVRAAAKDSKDNPLLRAREVSRAPGADASVFAIDDRHASIEYLSPDENAIYAAQTVRLHQLFYWLAKIKGGHVLARKYLALPEEGRTWKELGALALGHLYETIGPEQVGAWADELVRQMGLASRDELPARVGENPWYFVFMPSGADLALEWVKDGVLEAPDPFPEIGYRTRQWLFHRSLYLTQPAVRPIAVNRVMDGQ